MNATLSTPPTREELRDKWADVLSGFLFGMPNDVQDTLTGLSKYPGPLQETAQSFVGNIQRATTAATIPFSMTNHAVMDKQFALLFAAERIRELKGVVPGGELTEEQTQRAAIKARARLNDASEVEQGKTVEECLQRLHFHLTSAEFRPAAMDLLRQTIAAVWGAFELLVNEALIVAINNKPRLAVQLMETPPARKHFQRGHRWMIDELPRHNFNLSKSMGDVLLADRAITSLQKIRDIFSVVAPGDAALTTSLNDDRLWLVWQRRHVIVHRNGLVDRVYCKQTNDAANRQIGQPLCLTSDDVESALALIVNAGDAVLSALIW